PRPLTFAPSPYPTLFRSLSLRDRDRIGRQSKLAAHLLHEPALELPIAAGPLPLCHADDHRRLPGLEARVGLIGFANGRAQPARRSEEDTSELQSRENLVC